MVTSCSTQQKEPVPVLQHGQRQKAGGLGEGVIKSNVSDNSTGNTDVISLALGADKLVRGSISGVFSALHRCQKHRSHSWQSSAELHACLSPHGRPLLSVLK